MNSRAEDHACSKSKPATTPGYPIFASNSSDSGIEAHPTSKDPAINTAVGIANMAPAKEISDGGSTDTVIGDRSDNHCVTLAITTCKRLHGFLGTVEGLQAS